MSGGTDRQLLHRAAGCLAALALTATACAAAAQDIDCAVMVGRVVCEHQRAGDRATRREERRLEALKRQVGRLVAAKKCDRAEAAALKGGNFELAKDARSACSTTQK